MPAAKGNGANGVHSTSALKDAQYLYINGKDVPSSQSITFPVTNPMTGETIYECSSATVDDYNTAIEAAHKAYKSWSRTPPSARRLILLKAADIIETYLNDDGEVDAAEILSSEVSATKSWVGVNIRASAGILRESAGLVTHIKGEVVPADRPGTMILVVRESVGVVFAISPWNSPVSPLVTTILSNTHQYAR